ncbi:unnamed protein product, partial [Coregonus sp. 'balchen']
WAQARCGSGKGAVLWSSEGAGRSLCVSLYLTLNEPFLPLPLLSLSLCVLQCVSTGAASLPSIMAHVERGGLIEGGRPQGMGIVASGAFSSTTTSSGQQQ